MILILNINCSQESEKKSDKISSENSENSENVKNFENIIWNAGPSSDNSDGPKGPIILNMCSFTGEDDFLAIVQIEQINIQNRGLCQDTNYSTVPSMAYDVKILHMFGQSDLPLNIKIIDIKKFIMGRFRYQIGDFSLIRFKEYKDEYFAQGSIKIEENDYENNSDEYIVELPTNLEEFTSSYNETLRNIDQCPKGYEFTTQEWEDYIYGRPSDCPNSSETEENNSNSEEGCDDDPESENACP